MYSHQRKDLLKFFFSPLPKMSEYKNKGTDTFLQFDGTFYDLLVFQG